VKIPPAPFTKGGDIWGLAKRGDILRLFSDRMLASFRKQQNIPPFEKGGSGGIFYTIVMEKELIKFHHFGHFSHS
jgi:hypothetical protein